MCQDLGVTISYDQSWSKHVSHIESKANKVLGVIKHSIRNDYRHVFSSQYKSLLDQSSNVLPSFGART